MHKTIPEGDTLFPEYYCDKLEVILTEQGHSIICGVDEAGRGPLAGPVVAAAVNYHDCEALWRAKDSKVLTADKRSIMYSEIIRQLDYGIGLCSAEEIDTHNILQASLIAMSRAVCGLKKQPTLILVDGNHKLQTETVSRAIVKGDRRVAVISAASIIAKVTRDRIMTEYDKTYPSYGFSKNFGYPTQEHLTALKLYGPTDIHRKTYRGVREVF